MIGSKIGFSYGEHSEMLLLTDVRWLNLAKFLLRFRQLLSQVRSYLETKGDLYPELNDKEWLRFLT